MATYREEPAPVERQVVQEPGSSLASYALVKYGFLLAITVVILYFVAHYILNR